MTCLRQLVAICFDDGIKDGGNNVDNGMMMMMR